MRLNKNIVLIIILAIVLMTVTVYYFYFYKEPQVVQKTKQIRETKVSDEKRPMSSSFCLKEDEIAEYTTEEKVDGADSAIIFVKNKNTKEEKYHFKIDIISATHYHPLEIHKCWVYGSRSFNYDYKNKKVLPNYRAEIWRYSFDGKEESIVLLGNIVNGKYRSIFSNDFRVDPTESYTALKQNYLGEPNYALIVKDLKTLEDIFTLPMSEIEKKNSNIAGNIGFKNWSRDGRYFWADMAYGANEIGFIRIDMQTKNFDLFPAPENMLGGDAVNIEKGLVTVSPGNVWYGVEQIYQEEKAKRREKGIGTELHIYNLFTNEKILVAKTDEPIWYFRPLWLSDTELEYELPSGEREIYEIAR